MSVAITANEGGLFHLVEVATALAKLPHVTEEPIWAPDQVCCPMTSTVVPALPSTAFALSQQQRIVTSDEDDDAKNNASSPTTALAALGGKEIFPERLLAILNDPSVRDIVTWIPHGRSFIVLRPDVFAEDIVPKYIPPLDARASTKYPSFTRKLNRW